MSASAPRLWLVTPSVDALDATAALRTAEPAGLQVVNAAELGALVDPLEMADPEAGASRVLGGNPVLRLATQSAGIAFDYLDIGYRLVSARLREAMQLADDDAQFLDVDASGCPPAVRAMDYRWLHLTHDADPFDHDRSDGGVQDVRFGPIESWFGATPVKRWRLATPSPDRSVRIRWREGFSAPAPLFQAVGVPWTLATDELATRICAAGITDVTFQDVTLDVEPPPYIIVHQ